MDELERELSEMLTNRVEGLPESYEATPQLLGRVQRRRRAKLTAIAAAALVVVVGATGAIAQTVGRRGNNRVSTAPPSTTAATSTSSTEVSTTTRPAAPPSVSTVACPVTYTIQGTRFPQPSTAPRVPTAGDPAVLAHLGSYAGTTDPRYVVLGPAAWSCQMQVATDGDNALVVYPPLSGGVAVPDLFKAPIAIENDFLWHGGVGSGAACKAFDDPAVRQYIAQNYPQEGPCPKAGRTVTRVDSSVSTFVDADGARGAGVIVLPSSQTADDGKLSVLTCRPTTGLTAADCDTIIADFVARNDPHGPPPTTPTTTGTTTGTTNAPSVATAACAVTSASPGSTPKVTTAPRVPPAGDPVLLAHLQSFAATNDPRYVVLGPTSWSCRAQLSGDGNDFVAVYDPATSFAKTADALTKAPIAIVNDWLWHGGIGSVTACSVFADPAVVRYVTQLYPQYLPCPLAGRTVTRVNAHIATFVGADGARGAGWIVLPSSRGADGHISVLTCRPTAGLTTAECDTIVADWAARASG